jgi:sporulation protein YlmC with PRC-barrel domain
MLGKEILDKEVIVNSGWKIGKAKDLVIDRQNWQITHLYVEVRGNIESELGITSIPLSHRHFPIPTSYVQGVGDIITLNATKEEIVAQMGANHSQTPSPPATSSA